MRRKGDEIQEKTMQTLKLVTKRETYAKGNEATLKLGQQGT